MNAIKKLSGKELEKLINDAGYKGVKSKNMTFGITTITDAAK